MKKHHKCEDFELWEANLSLACLVLSITAAISMLRGIVEAVLVIMGIVAVLVITRYRLAAKHLRWHINGGGGSNG